MGTLFKTSQVFILSLFIGLLTVSCGNDGVNVEIPDVDGPHVTLQEDDVQITMTLEKIQFEGELRYNIPKYPNSFMELTKDEVSGGVHVLMNLAITDIFNDDLLLENPERLPGGRPLPGVAAGALPAVAFRVDKIDNVLFYVGPELFGVFVDVDMDIDGSIATFRYFIGDRASGTISIVGRDNNGENSGILLLLNVDFNLKRRLLKLDQKY